MQASLYPQDRRPGERSVRLFFVLLLEQTCRGRATDPRRGKSRTFAGPTAPLWESHRVPAIRLARECQKLGQRAHDGAKVSAWHDCQARHAKVMRALTRRQVKGTTPAQSMASTVWSGSDGGTATVVGTCGADAGAVVDESAEKDAGARRMWNMPRHKDPWWGCCRPAPEFPQYGLRSRQCRGSRGKCTLPEIHVPPTSRMPKDCRRLSFHWHLCWLRDGLPLALRDAEAP